MLCSGKEDLFKFIWSRGRYGRIVTRESGGYFCLSSQNALTPEIRRGTAARSGCSQAVRGQYASWYCTPSPLSCGFCSRAASPDHMFSQSKTISPREILDTWCTLGQVLETGGLYGRLVFQVPIMWYAIIQILAIIDFIQFRSYWFVIMAESSPPCLYTLIDPVNLTSRLLAPT